MSLFKRLWSSDKAEKPLAQNFDANAGVKTVAPAAPQERRLRKRQNAKRGLSVLIIDDSPTIVAALGKTLRSAGYVTIEAANAEIALATLKETKPSLIFLDIILPGMNGFAALRLIRKQIETQDIPVIMISGNEHATEQFYGSRIGADDFMKKPFSRLEVFSRVEALLDVDMIPRRKGWLPSDSSGSRPLADSSVARPTAKSAAELATKSDAKLVASVATIQVTPSRPIVASPSATSSTAAQPAASAALIPHTMTALEARKELTAMGLLYFDREQYNAAARRGDKLAVTLFIRGGGIVANSAGASRSSSTSTASND